jgi:hypothetical protein
MSVFDPVDGERDRMGHRIPPRIAAFRDRNARWTPPPFEGGVRLVPP